MRDTTRVDLHCHSTRSDGMLAPREVARMLQADGVVAAALTDHDTTDGLAEFREALDRRGIGFVTGVELTVRYHEEEAHLLGYGVDPEHRGLQAAMGALRQAHLPHYHSIADSLRGRSAAPPADADPEVLRAAANGGLDIAEAIALIHDAGGKAFLAHPHMLAADLNQFRAIFEELQAQGLDGVEAYYRAYTPVQRQMLADLAEELGLLTSGGSDAHERRGPATRDSGVDMPTAAWKRFRDAVSVSRAAGAAAPAPPWTPPPKWRHFLSHFLLPTVLALALFAVAVFGVFLPTFQRSLLERKREMIRELTNSAWSILAGYERDERAGRVPRAQAQELARQRIESLRYGRDGKDYFWLQDLHPRIVMHPYRKDLNGQDVSDFRDQRGVPIFVQFAGLARRQGEGYVEYYWQWKDDPTRVVPKESYIRAFRPWGWVIGTGIYLDDVHAEIARVQRSLLHTLLAISAIVVLLLVYVMQQSLRLERERSDAEQSLRESTDRYRSVVEATTEGTLLVLDGRCRYANPPFLQMVGCTAQELALLDLADVAPEIEGNETMWRKLRELPGDALPEGFEGLLRRRDGVLIECVLSLSRVTMGEQEGFLVLAREVGAGGAQAGLVPAAEAQAQTLQELTEEVPAGLFRARATAQGTILYANSLATEFLRAAPRGADEAPLTLAALFPEAGDYEAFLAELEKTGAAVRRLSVSSGAPSTRLLDVHAALVRAEAGRTDAIDGLIQDVTAHARQAAEREAVLEHLQASLLFLHEPVSALQRPAPTCDLHTPVHVVAALMTDEQATAALVRADDGTAVGIITDHDLRERIVAAKGDVNQPAHRLMSSPLTTIHEHAEVYQALLRMEERGVQHLAVTDDDGRVVGLLRNQELLQFQSYGATVLTREIMRSETVEEVVKSCRRVPALTRALIVSDAHPERVTSMISSASDAAVERFVALAQAELGPSPVPFAFVALGSQGRQEQTLTSDQDNAIIYRSPDGAASPAATEYLGELARRVCGWLDEAGTPYCRGDVMAQNLRWCQPLQIWQRTFADWIRGGDPQQVLEFSIFFDLRAVWGEAELVHELRRHVHAVVRETPGFLLHLAQNSLLFKPPLRLLGRLVGGVEHTRQLNLKDALMPLVNFARLYALKHGLAQTHTLERLAALAEQGVLTPSSHEETAAAYKFLMRLRLRGQSEALQAGLDPDNSIYTRSLQHAEAMQLNQAFAQIDAIQKRINHDFLGG